MHMGKRISLISVILGLLFSSLSIWAQDSSRLMVQGKGIVLSSQYGEVQIDTLDLTIPAQGFMESLFGNMEQTSAHIQGEKTGVHSLVELLSMSFLYFVVIVAGIIAFFIVLMLLFAMLRRKNEEADKYLKWMWYCLLIISFAVFVIVLLWGKNRQELAIGIIGSVFGSALYGYLIRLNNRGIRNVVKDTHEE